MTISASTQAMTRSAISMPLQLRWFGFADTNCEIEKAQFNFSSTLLLIYINFIHYIAITLYTINIYVYIIHYIYTTWKLFVLIYVMLLPPPVRVFLLMMKFEIIMVLMCVRLMKVVFFFFFFYFLFFTDYLSCYVFYEFVLCTKLTK